MNATANNTETRLQAAASQGFLLLRVTANLAGNDAIKQILAVVAIGAVFPTILTGVCFFENTFYLRSASGGRGLLEHYGTWSLALAIPLVLWMLVNILHKSDTSLAQLSRSSASEESAQGIADAKGRLEEILKCYQMEHRICFYLLVVVGVFATVSNLQNTRQAVAVYGHDVWDSSEHIFGFITGKILVGTLFAYVIPVTVYVASTVWFTILSLSSKVANTRSVRVSPYHPDKCGGFRHLGRATIAVSQLCLPFLVTVVGHYCTHESFYESLLLASITVFAATIALLYLPFVELHRHLKGIKTTLLEELQQLLDAQSARFVSSIHSKDNSNGATHQLSILACTTLYQQAEKLNTWPYLASDHAKWLSIIISPTLAYVLKRTFGG